MTSDIPATWTVVARQTLGGGSRWDWEPGWSEKRVIAAREAWLIVTTIRRVVAAGPPETGKPIFELLARSLKP